MTISAEEIAKALVILARLNVPVDIQELLVIGNPDQGISPGALAKVIATVVADMKAEIERLMVLTGEYSVALDDARMAFEEKNTRIAALEAQLAERVRRLPD